MLPQVMPELMLLQMIALALAANRVRRITSVISHLQNQIGLLGSTGEVPQGVLETPAPSFLPRQSVTVTAAQVEHVARNARVTPGQFFGLLFYPTVRHQERLDPIL
ncbi:hypothetical protein D3C73_1281190 [compost metagenome]